LSRRWQRQPDRERVAPGAEPEIVGGIAQAADTDLIELAKGEGGEIVLGFIARTTESDALAIVKAQEISDCAGDFIPGNGAVFDMRQDWLGQAFGGGDEDCLGGAVPAVAAA